MNSRLGMQTSFVFGAQCLSIKVFLLICTCMQAHTIHHTPAHKYSFTNTRQNTRTGQCKDTNPLQLQSDQPWKALVLSPLPSLKHNLNTYITPKCACSEWLINTQTFLIALLWDLVSKDKHWKVFFKFSFDKLRLFRLGPQRNQLCNRLFFFTQIVGVCACTQAHTNTLTISEHLLFWRFKIHKKYNSLTVIIAVGHITFSLLATDIRFHFW